MDNAAQSSRATLPLVVPVPGLGKIEVIILPACSENHDILESQLNSSWLFDSYCKSAILQAYHFDCKAVILSAAKNLRGDVALYKLVLACLRGIITIRSLVRTLFLLHNTEGSCSFNPAQGSDGLMVTETHNERR
jgi:hypothetical protein